MDFIVVDTQYQLLLIEDDLPLAELIIDFLQDYEFSVSHADEGKKAIALTKKQRFDLVICDILLPDIEGFELLPKLSLAHQCPVIFLTAILDDSSQIKGLGMGASDYIMKPVAPEILLARIRANIRQIEGRTLSDNLSIGPLYIDKSHEKITYHGKDLTLTSQEFEIIWFFCAQGDKIIDREMLFQELIGRPYDGQDRAADLRISRLRKKLLTLGYKELTIDSIRSKGYLFKFWASLGNA